MKVKPNEYRTQRNELKLPDVESEMPPGAGAPDGAVVVAAEFDLMHATQQLPPSD